MKSRALQRTAARGRGGVKVETQESQGRFGRGGYIFTGYGMVGRGFEGGGVRVRFYTRGVRMGTEKLMCLEHARCQGWAVDGRETAGRGYIQKNLVFQAEHLSLCLKRLNLLSGVSGRRWRDWKPNPLPRLLYTEENVFC